MTPRRSDTGRRGASVARGELVEGRRAVRELLIAQRRPVHDVWMSSEADRAPILDEIAGLATAAGAHLHRVPAEQVARQARTDAPQGVVARAAPLPAANLGELLEDPTAFLVALDGVTDPQNLGSVLRSAETAGATGVIVPRHRAAGITATVAKAAAGAIEHLPIATVAGIPSALEQARRANVWCVGLDGDGDTSLFELPIADRSLVLVLGAEGAGLSKLSRQRCDLVAAIPMWGSIESLNVGAAAAVACFEIARHRHG
jgi:23S rRNA (guanosine2251-2'-O)-methyltransferase